MDQNKPSHRETGYPIDLFLEHFLIETLCVSIVTLPTLRGKSAVFPLAYGAGVRSPSEAGQARPPERLPFSMAFRSKISDNILKILYLSDFA